MLEGYSTRWAHRPPPINGGYYDSRVSVTIRSIPFPLTERSFVGLQNSAILLGWEINGTKHQPPSPHPGGSREGEGNLLSDALHHWSP